MSAPLQKGTEVIAGESPHFSRRFLAAISSVPLRIATSQTSCILRLDASHRRFEAPQQLVAVFGH